MDDRVATGHLNMVPVIPVLLRDQNGTLPSPGLTVLQGMVTQRGLGRNVISQILLNSISFVFYLQNPNSKDVNHKIQKQTLLCLLELGFVLPLTRLNNQLCLSASSKSRWKHCKIHVNSNQFLPLNEHFNQINTTKHQPGKCCY